MPFPPAFFTPSGLGGTPADHLPSPRRPTHDAVEILYLGGGGNYDGGSFLTYPSRRHWTEKDISDPKKSAKSSREIDSFFQTWFFWGLLTDVLRMPVHESDLVKENKIGQQVITTKSLPQLMHKWYDRDQFLSCRAQEKHALRVDKNLWRLSNILNWWNLNGTTPLDQWAATYLVMLGEYIQAGYKAVYNKASGLGSQATGMDSLNVPDWFSANRRWSNFGMKAISGRMAAGGWCRSDIQRLGSTLLTHGLFYASMLKPPGHGSAPQILISKQLANDFMSSNYKHQHCSDFSCCAYQWDKMEYKTKHVSENCTCGQRKVCISNLVRNLDKGQIPVIRLQDGIKVLPAMPGVRYVAISHVWSDGLGNPNANALPHCRLEHIARCVKNLYHPSEEDTAFWIDTLCCPVEPYEARVQAISLMRKTYQAADRVLVIESYLQSQPIAALSTMEILMIIHCSKWNRRLWTLQEQIFARKRLHFQFNDMSLCLDNIILREVLDMNPDEYLSADLKRLAAIYQISYGTSGIMKAVWGDHAVLNVVDGSSVGALAAIQRMLPFRATTKASDEALCLGSLLNLDVQRILSVPKAARMETLWSQMPHIPPDVIFWIGPKLQRKGFRWAPSTFLNGRDLHHNSELTSAVATNLTRKGLRVRYPGWMLGCRKRLQVKARFYFMDTSGTLYMVSCLDGASREYLAPDRSLDPWSLEPAHISQLALHVISQFDLDAAGSDGPRVCNDALLVVAYDVDQETLLVRSVCPVTVRKLEAEAEETQSLRNCARSILVDVEPHLLRMGLWSSSPRLQSNPDVIDLMGCSAISTDQPWCVD